MISLGMQQNSTLPVTIVITARTTGGASCLSAEMMDAQKKDINREVQALLQKFVVPDAPPCQCDGGGDKVWTRIAYVNMSDPFQQCPINWTMTTAPIRGCGLSYRRSDHYICNSAFFSYAASNDTDSYSHVCGRVMAYQKGSPDAFHSYLRYDRGLEQAYLDGVSLTHGTVGSRQHIWSFTASNYEIFPNEYRTSLNCACTNTGENWVHQIPPFIGNNYFCDTGNPGPGFSHYLVFADDPLWDGQGCGPTNTCCEFNNPPWFCTTLPQPTSDDLELRICSSNPK